MTETKQHAVVRWAVQAWVARCKQEDLYFYLTQDDPKVIKLIDNIDFDLNKMK